MSLFFYNLGIRLMYLVIRLASVRSPKAKKWAEGRKDWAIELQKKLSGNTSPIIWFHVSSLGEFEQARPVMQRFRFEYPRYKILATFFSPSGYELRKNDPLVDFTSYLPLDTRQNASGFLELAKPKLAFFVRYEFWHHFIHETSQREIPLVCISAHFRKDQIFFKPWGRLFRQMIHCFDHVFVQDPSSIALLGSIGYKKSTISGDSRVDRVADLPSESRPIPEIEKFVARAGNVLVAGSVWPEDLECILPWINQAPEGWKFIIAPHEISKESIQSLLNKLKLTTTRFSKGIDPNTRILVLDTIGQLAQSYRFATVAYVGGAFRQGLHNILEPAAFGKPVIFGPNTHGFPEADAIVRLGGACSVATTKEFAQAIEDIGTGKISGRAAAKYIAENKGAAGKVMEYVDQISLRWKE